MKYKIGDRVKIKVYGGWALGVIYAIEGSFYNVCVDPLEPVAAHGRYGWMRLEDNIELYEEFEGELNFEIQC